MQPRVRGRYHRSFANDQSALSLTPPLLHPTVDQAAHDAGDPDVLSLIAGLMRQYLEGAGEPTPQLSRKRRDAARKRLARAILRGQLDGFLP